MNPYRIIALTVLLPILALPIVASAETVLRVGESVNIASDQRVEEDLYAAAGTVAVSGEVAGDVYAIGGSVTTNGPITEDLSVLGGSVQVHAPVSDDVRVVGGDVTIADDVGGDVFVIAGSLTILSSASIAGDVFFYGGEATIAGAVGGSIMGTAERFRVDTAVGGDVDVSSSRALVLGDRASIAGDVRYQSFDELTRAQNAVIEGSVVRNEAESEVGSGRDYGTALLFFTAHLFAALCLYLLFRNSITGFVRETINNYGRSGVVGLAAFFVAPIVVILLMVTMLGLLLGIVGLFALTAAYFVAFILTAMVAGGGLAKLLGRQIEVNFVWILGGVVVLHLLRLIPFVGPLVLFTLFIFTLGGLLWRGYRMVR